MAEAVAAEPYRSAVRMLLVEDNPSDAFIIGSLLQGYRAVRYETRHVKTQSEALMALNGQAFDVCLLDLTLPDAAGFSALIDIQEKAPDMPVLILTGVHDTSLAKRAVGRGAQDYLQKDGMEPEALMRAIDYAIERKRIETELFQRANYDALTGLANRSLFEARLRMALARAGRGGAGIAILFIDLDGFKSVNDQYGHKAGDSVLAAVAQRIKSVLRPYDTAARFGGDEFAVLLESVPSTRDTAMIAQKIIGVLAPPLHADGAMLKVGASIGIAFCDTPQRAETLLQNADAAMYQAKEDGGKTYRFYAPDIHRKAETRLRMEEEFRHAIRAGQLTLRYQPYMTLQDETPLGLEALLRWEHPERGLLLPSEFLKLAEECRLMHTIGKWMFSAMRNDIAAWNIQGVPPLEIAFNVSGSQLDGLEASGGFASFMEEDVFGHHRFAVEIDSDALTALTEQGFLLCARLCEMGVALHVDHFGQGLLSLQTLHALPFAMLKLNLMALGRMEDAKRAEAITLTAIGLAHQLGMKAGAVGVETPGQMQMLRAQRCDVIQGFLVGCPLAAQQVPAWMHARAS